MTSKARPPATTWPDRLAFHQDPGEPRIQQRSGGQWILITERKTGDGGTVAIYSDITDLKQHEEELTTKSNTLEETNKRLKKAQEQISKHIDPNITEKYPMVNFQRSCLTSEQR